MKYGAQLFFNLLKASDNGKSNSVKHTEHISREDSLCPHHVPTLEHIDQLSSFAQTSCGRSKGTLTSR